MNQADVGYMSNSQEGAALLSSLFVQRDDGLHVDLKNLEEDGFRTLVERVFGSDSCFFELDYEAFTRLLYDFDALRQSLSAAESRLSTVRIATDIIPFPPQRRALYKSVKMDNGKAEYYFEPVYLEVPQDGNGETAPQRAVLSFDEFVADMWSKGVRYGIDAAAVRAAIESGRSGRIVAARRLEPVLGKAADIQELSETIHRDNAPNKLSNGRLDLSQFKNRFPQIKTNVRLMKKIPRVMGAWGWELSGNPVKPPVPSDFDLAQLAGPGTEVERTAEGEFIVAKCNGFLNLDSQSNQISIMEKIVNREGVSVRTTGNLQLSGNEYEEYGEVQEKRQIEGYNITIHADVFGSISSLGGNIVLKRNLVGGSAVNEVGDIVVDGVASGATLHAKHGAVILKRAENCIIIGSRVELQAASNCDIMADEVSIAEAEGCALQAKSIRLHKAGPRKQSEMLVFVRIPDQAAFDNKEAELRRAGEEIDVLCKAKNAEIEQVRSLPEVRNYLLVAGKLKKNEITLSAEQKANFTKLGASVAPTLKTVARTHAEIGELQAKKSAIAAQMAEVAAQKQESVSGISCSIGELTGDVLVRGAKYTPDADPFAQLSPKELRTRLRGSSDAGEKIFSGHGGSLDWSYGKPD